MIRPSIATVIAVAVVVLLTFFAPGLGSAGLWPVVIALAVGMSAAPSTGRLAAFVIGIGSAWLMFALRAGSLPDLAAGRAIAIGTAVLVVGAVAIVTRDRVPIWAGLTGVAVFGAAYAPAYAADPTLFLSGSVVALGEVALAAGIGFVAGYVIDGIVGPVSEFASGRDAPHRTIVLPDARAKEGVR